MPFGVEATRLEMFGEIKTVATGGASTVQSRTSVYEDRYSAGKAPLSLQRVVRQGDAPGVRDFDDYCVLMNLCRRYIKDGSTLVPS